MADHRLRFVASIAASPTTVLDLNDRTTFTLDSESFDFSPPEIDRAESSSILADGGVVSATALRNRTLTFTLFVQTATRDLMTTALSDLHKQLAAERNIVEFRHRDSTASRFFRTFRSTNTTVVDEGKAGEMTVQVALLCEPYAYGTLVTQTSLVVTNNPVAATRPCYLDVTGVTGDVPTPAVMTLFGTANQSFAIGVRRHGTPSNALPWVIQAEAMALDTGITALGASNDAAMSGTGQNYMRTTIPAGAYAMTDQIEKSIYGLTVDHRGTYRVFVRVRRTTNNTDVIKVRVNYSGLPLDSVIYYNPDVLTPTDTGTHLIDLGLVSFPVADDPVTSATGSALGVGDSYISLSVSRGGGGGSFLFDWDYLVFVPADEELTIVDAPSAAAADLVLDGDRRAAYYLSSGLVAGRQFPTVAGAIAPMLDPNVTNRIVFLSNVLAKSTQINSLAAATGVAVAWLPRFLYV